MDIDNNRENNEFNFQQLSKLYKEDPEKFEEVRQSIIDKVINKAPKDEQKRLRGLQFEIDATRNIAKNSYQSCIKISQMMMDKLMQLQQVLTNPEMLEKNKQAKAKVLSFADAKQLQSEEV